MQGCSLQPPLHFGVETLEVRQGLQQNFLFQFFNFDFKVRLQQLLTIESGSAVVRNFSTSSKSACVIAHSMENMMCPSKITLG